MISWGPPLELGIVATSPGGPGTSELDLCVNPG